MKVRVEFDTVSSVERFTQIAQTVEEDVRLVGEDENGASWEMSAKSLMCSLIVSARLQHNRKHTAHQVNWGTIWCVCEKDIYNLIREFVRISPDIIEQANE